MRDKKVKREIEEIGKDLTERIYRRTLDRLEGEHYGRCAARFDGMVRRGEIVVEECGEDMSEMFDGINWITT